MSILKQKIKACTQAKLKSPTLDQSIPTHKVFQSQQNSPDLPQGLKLKKSNSEPKKRQRLKGDCFTPKCYLQAKNIVTNFGKAIATFGLSKLALPYLSAELEKPKYEGKLQVSDFIEFMKENKANINSIDNLRNLLLTKDEDSAKSIALKQCFQVIAEIFIKYFSVNWIIHGRVTYKLEHLKFRFKMLRRIQNPQQFTYLKSYNDQKLLDKEFTKDSW